MIGFTLGERQAIGHGYKQGPLQKLISNNLERHRRGWSNKISAGQIPDFMSKNGDLYGIFHIDRVLGSSLVDYLIDMNYTMY